MLAWIGGVATLFGIVLFLALAVARGWIGPEARTALAGLGSLALLGLGTWLHARRGRTEASVVLVGVATCGLFVTLLVAAHVYALIPPQLAVVGALITGAAATILAIRWAGIAIALLGLIGALLSPVFVGAPIDALTLTLLAVAAACATWTAVWQRWEWLAYGALAICIPQWGQFVLGDHPLGLRLAVVVAFGAIGMAGALATQSASRSERLVPAAVVMLTTNATVVALLGAVALRGTDGSAPLGGDALAAWFVAVGAVHAAIGLVRIEAICVPMRRLGLVVGLILADVAFGLTASGLTLAIGWAALGVAFAALTRRPFTRSSDLALVEIAMGAHIALALFRAVITAPPSAIGSGTAGLVALLSLAVLAGACIASAVLVRPGAPELKVVLNALGLAAIAYLTAQALSGAPQTVAWALEGLALAGLAARTDDRLAEAGAAAFAGLAVLHAIVIDAPPSSLVAGAPSLLDAAVALGAIAGAGILASRSHERARSWLLAGGAVTLLYLASVAIISAFQPTAGAVDPSLLELSVRQQGQVVLSGCWSLLGLGLLITALRTNRDPLRNAALALLLLTVAKVFLYDLSTLTSLYRVISFIALGLLLLAGAFAYQRLRPPPVPDMRGVHPSQR